MRRKKCVRNIKKALYNMAEEYGGRIWRKEYGGKNMAERIWRKNMAEEYNMAKTKLR